MKLRIMIARELVMLRNIAPKYADRIYDEVKAESNPYGSDEEYIRLCRVNRALLHGLSPEYVLEMVKNNLDAKVEFAILMNLL